MAAGEAAGPPTWYETTVTTDQPPSKPPGDRSPPSQQHRSPASSSAGPPARAHTETAGHRYDPAELGRLLTLAHSPSELAELASRAGVALPPRSPTDPAGSELARILVRRLASRGELPQFVDRLRRDKPLVEWPAASGSAPPVTSSEPAATRSAPAPSDEPAAHTTLDDGADAASRDAPAPAPSPPASPVLPPLEAAEARGSRLWMVATITVASLAVVAAAVIAFVVGRSSSAPSSSEPAPAEGPRAVLAGNAAAELDGSIRAVAKACALPDRSGTPAEVLARAFRSCAERGRTVPLVTSVTPEPAPTATAPATEPQRPTGAADPSPPPPRASGCLARCREQHERCKATECGPEPKLGSQYADYQRCLSRCLAKASQCRMRCG